MSEHIGIERATMPRARSARRAVSGVPHRDGVQLGAEALLHLQRTAGNRVTTTAVLQRQRGPRFAPAQQAISIFYVSFTHEAPPAAPDHSRPNPGPAGSGTDRAGHTQALLHKRMTIAWDTGPPEADGRVPLFAKSVNVYYTLDLNVAVSSDYSAQSCPYRVTLAHENSHAEAFVRIFRESRQVLVRQLEGVDIPTRIRPALVTPNEVAMREDEIGERLKQVIIVHARQLVSAMKVDRNAKDAPAAYQAIYTRCPASEW